MLAPTYAFAYYAQKPINAKHSARITGQGLDAVSGQQ